jgi:hypothetical protein
MKARSQIKDSKCKMIKTRAQTKEHNAMCDMGVKLLDLFRDIQIDQEVIDPRLQTLLYKILGSGDIKLMQQLESVFLLMLE